MRAWHFGMSFGQVFTAKLGVTPSAAASVYARQGMASPWHALCLDPVMSGGFVEPLTPASREDSQGGITGDLGHLGNLAVQLRP